MEPYYQDSHCTIYHGDCRAICENIPDSSIDMIFTDPPYLKKYLYLYEWLAKEGARMLKTDKFLMAYAGAYWKDEIMSMLRCRLNYFYDFILHHKGNTTILWPRKIISGYKSVLCYQKGERGKPTTTVLGLFTGLGGDKRFHKWGQSEILVDYYLRCFTKPGDTVLDPFCGAGTVGAVCKYLNRKSISIEIDPNEAENAKLRITNQHPAQRIKQEVLAL